MKAIQVMSKDVITLAAITFIGVGLNQAHALGGHANGCARVGRRALLEQLTQAVVSGGGVEPGEQGPPLGRTREPLRQALGPSGAGQRRAAAHRLDGCR